MQVTDGSFRVFARFDGVPVAVAAAGDRVVVGLGSNDGAVVAILDSSGSTVAQVDSVESDGPPLLTVADGRVWIGVTGTLPVDAGFAERQWFLVSDLDGEPYDTPTRSEGMPLDGGRAFHVTDTGVTLYDEENTGTEWTIGGGGTITSAHPFLDGVLVTWTTDDDASAGTSYAAYLTKDGQATGIEYARTGFAARAPEQSIDVGPQGLVTIDGTADDVRVSILSLEGLEPLGPMSIGGLDWIRAVYPSGVFGSDGRRLTRTSPVLHSVKSAAWDGDEGIVMIDPEGRLLRIHPGGEDVIAELPDDLQELVAVVDVDGRSIAGYTRLEGNATTITWIDITTGEPADGPGDRVVLRGDGRIELAAQGRRARIDHPDWSGVPRGEGGEPVPPFPLPELVITDDAGTELLRLPIGSEQRPLAVLHDFDGRRVIVSAEPWEPAAAPRTVWIVDLECVACTQTVDAGPDSFDLIGIATSEGPIDAFEPLVPSETG
jgi:hypothetical protein